MISEASELVMASGMDRLVGTTLVSVIGAGNTESSVICDDYPLRRRRKSRE
jgi:hypothetical protein